MTRLPPGQIETKRFPVVGERVPSDDLATDPDSWEMEVTGEVEKPFRMSLGELIAMPQDSLEFDIHCVTSWSRFNSTFTGVPLSLLLERAKPNGTGTFVSFEAYSSRDHHTSLPLDVARTESWVVHSFDRAPLTLEHGGPVRVVTPGRYFYKSIKWLRRIEVLEEDRLGWWETNSSYHNNADPTTGEERFTTGSLRPEQLARFLAAERYDKYRGRVLLGLDLREWEPGSNDLSRLQLKNCDLRGVELAGVDLRNSNLSLSDLGGANLAGADLSGSDLEGANFVAADVSGADFSGCRLSATRFVEADSAATVTNATFDGVFGLLEHQESFLRRQGIQVRAGATG